MRAITKIKNGNALIPSITEPTNVLIFLFLEIPSNVPIMVPTMRGIETPTSAVPKSMNTASKTRVKTSRPSTSVPKKVLPSGGDIGTNPG